jgi:hypothetical protein
MPEPEATNTTPETTTPAPTPTPETEAPTIPGGLGDDATDIEKAASILEAAQDDIDAEEIVSVPEDDPEPTPDKPEGEQAEDKPEQEAAKPEGDDDKKPEAEASGDKPEEEGSKDETPLDRSWAAIKRAEQKIRKEREDFKAERQQFDTLKNQYEAQNQGFQELTDRLRSDPMGVLKQMGFTFEDIAKRELNEGSASAEEMARRASTTSDERYEKQGQEIAQLKAMIEAQNQQRGLEKYRGMVDQALSEDQFTLLRANPNAAEAMMQMGMDHALEHGEVLHPRDAAVRLQKEWEAELRKLGSHQAVMGILGGQSSSNGDDSQPKPDGNSGASDKPEPGKTKPKTLTNNLAAAPPKSDVRSEDMSEKEIVAAAAKSIPPDFWPSNQQ